MKVVIVGGVAGGASVAARIRRLDEKAEIKMFEKSGYISFANCGLPYYISGKIRNRGAVLLFTTESFNKRFNIESFVNTEVISIDRKNKTVEVLDRHTNKVLIESYDKLVLSPGSAPFIPKIEGLKREGIFTLRNVEDADAIRKYITENKPKRAIVVGAGYIGLEMAENFCELGIETIVVEAAKELLAPFDSDMSAIVAEHLKESGPALLLGREVKCFENAERGFCAVLSDGTQVKAEIAVIATGVKPEISLASGCSLAIGKNGGIKVDEYMNTQDPSIYALGDVVEVIDPITKTYRLIPLAGPASKQARIVADNIVYGNTKKYSGTLGASIVKVFKMAAGCVGNNENSLKKSGVSFSSAIVHTYDHASYYPGAQALSVKVLFDETDGKIFGAQAVGFGAVDKTIDIFSLAIKNSLGVNALVEFEHSYAPPFASAKSPVNVIANVCDNIISGKIKLISSKTLKELSKGEVYILDVRENSEVAFGKIEGSINIPLGTLRERLNEIPVDKKIVVHCAAGLRSYQGARILMQNGFKNVYSLSGGYKTWKL